MEEVFDFLAALKAQSRHLEVGLLTDDRELLLQPALNLFLIIQIVAPVLKVAGTRAKLFKGVEACPLVINGTERESYLKVGYLAVVLADVFEILLPRGRQPS